ncbi:MAG TPA: DUF2877 domain-containing protein [bacterium]|nr:DUF2877 domain-containing protein [bacterium]
MNSRVEALSMSWRVGRAFRQEGWDGEILAVHPRSCYLMDEDGAIYAIVQESLGNGPLNLVIPDGAGQPFQHLSVGETVRSNGHALLLSDSLDVGLAAARLWDPKPYTALGVDPERLGQAMSTLLRAVTAAPPEKSLALLLPYLQEEELPAPLLKVTHFPRSHALMGGLAESLALRNRRGLKVVTSSMAGLGPGLTPSGDDFIGGVLLALALAREDRPDAELKEIGGLLLETAAPRTHEISAAYLKAAHAGEASDRWHRLLGALASGDPPAIVEAAHGVMRTGETSGADMLSGFIIAMQAIRRVPSA